MDACHAVSREHLSLTEFGLHLLFPDLILFYLFFSTFLLDKQPSSFDFDLLGHTVNDVEVGTNYFPFSPSITLQPPVAFGTAQPVAVPLRGEPNMPPPPSVFVPPGEEATVATEEEGKPRGDPHRPDRASDSESLNSAGSAMNETSDATGTMDYSPGHDDTQDSLPEPST